MTTIQVKIVSLALFNDGSMHLPTEIEAINEMLKNGWSIVENSGNSPWIVPTQQSGPTIIVMKKTTDDGIQAPPQPTQHSTHEASTQDRTQD